MRPNKIRQLLDAGKPTLCTRVLTVNPLMIEMIGQTGLFDYVEFAGEYAPFTVHDLDNFCRAAELNDLNCMIKVDQEPRGWLARRAVGSGFQSILFADCRTPEDVRSCVAQIRADTPGPDGLYGVAPLRFAYAGGAGTPEYVKYLDDVVVNIMIEKKGTVDTLEEVLSIKGVDMIQWGASDFSMSIGIPGQRQAPKVVAAHDIVFKTALAMGVQPRAEIGHPDQAKRYLDMGVRHFSLGNDLRIVTAWLGEHGDAMRRTLAGE